jgi:outer membrane receptor protein involved in Fe transport
VSHIFRIVFCCLAAVACLLAQAGESTEILGVVEDSTGAVVPGVEITATHVATGQSRKTVTGDSGVYVFSFMQPGEYTISAAKTGFKTEVRSGLTLQLNQKARVNFSMQVGGVAESVEVSAAGVILNTDDATIGNVVDQKRVTDLPLNGRNFANLAGLMPGVIKGISSNTNQYGRSDSAITVSADGVRENQGQVLFDGVSTAWNINNATFFKPSIEAIEEFKVHAATYSAEYGHNAGAQVEVLTRSGTNNLHGALFEFVRNSDFDARNYFRPAPLSKDTLQRNQFGFVLSGPVWIPKVYDGKNRTFWMVNFEAQREKAESAQNASVIPLPYRTGNFSALSTPLKDPLGGTFPGNIIPANRLDPIAQNYFKYEVPPNLAGTGVNLAGVEKDINDINQVFARVDHNITTADRLFVRGAFFAYDFPTTPPDIYSPLISRITAQNAVLSETHVFSPTVLNEVKLGYNRNWVFRRGIRTNTAFDPESMGLTGVRSIDPNTGVPRRLTPLETGIVPMNVTGYLTIGDGGLIPDFNLSTTWQLADNITINRGVHTFKAGFDFRRLRMDRSGSNNARGFFNFNGQATGSSAADFALGFPSQSETPNGILPVQYRQHTYAAFVQDEWKVTPALTVNLGVRFDDIGFIFEKNGLPRELKLDQPGGYLFPTDPNSKAVVNFYPATTRLWPRMGLAWRPANNWVVRLGGGVYNNADQMNNLTVVGNPLKTFVVDFIADPANPSALTLQNPYPISQKAAAPPLNVVAAPPDRTDAYNIQWSASIERQLSTSTSVEIAYVGSEASHLDNSRNYNDAPPGPGPVQARRPYPQWGSIRWLGSDAKSYFESLQLRGERRFSRGMSFLASYTWAHNIDTSYGTNESLPFTPGGVQNDRCWGCERSNSGFDYRHRVAVSYLWNIPAPKDWRGVAASALKNWSLNGVVTYQTGFPFTVTQTGNLQNTGAATQRPNYVPGVDPHPPDPGPSLWFNPKAFQFANLQFGSVGRNTLRQPGIKTWDIGLFKEFPVREVQRFQFRMEAFNLYNTPQFSAPNAQFGAPGFGQMTSTWLANRQVQFGLKYLF